MKIFARYKFVIVVAVVMAVFVTMLICNYCIKWDNEYYVNKGEGYCTSASELQMYRKELDRYNNVKLLQETKLNGYTDYTLNFMWIDSHLSNDIDMNYIVDDEQQDDVVVRIYYISFSSLNLYDAENNVSATVDGALASITIKCVKYKVINDTADIDTMYSMPMTDLIVVLITKKAQININ